MRIGLDLDDVLAQFMKSFVEFHNRLYGTSLTKGGLTSYHLEDHVPSIDRAEAIARVSRFVSSEYHDSMEPYEGAVRVTRRLVEEGHELHLITSRPELYRSRSEEWLDRHFSGSFSGIHFCNKWSADPRVISRSKGELCAEQRIDLFVDDHHVYADECAERGVRVLLLTQPWNRTYDERVPIVRVDSWDAIDKLVETYK